MHSKLLDEVGNIRSIDRSIDRFSASFRESISELWYYLLEALLVSHPRPGMSMSCAAVSSVYLQPTES